MSNLIYYPSSALLTQCADVNFDKIDVQQYYDSMIDVMYKNNGIGLAAPQVGLPWRFFLMHNNMYINPIILGFVNLALLMLKMLLSNIKMFVGRILILVPF